MVNKFIQFVVTVVILFMVGSCALDTLKSIQVDTVPTQGKNKRALSSKEKTSSYAYYSGNEGVVLEFNSYDPKMEKENDTVFTIDKPKFVSQQPAERLVKTPAYEVIDLPSGKISWFGEF